MTLEELYREYPQGTKPDRKHFPYRNRIRAALGDKLIVRKPALKSGTMHTVDQALELGREIYVVPYRRDDPWAQGSNRLIQQGANIIFL